MSSRNQHAIILQLFDAPFFKPTISKQADAIEDTFRTLQNYASLGFSHIQIGPVQKHCSHIRKWHRLYQPVDASENCIGNSLGSEKDLERFIHLAHSVGLRVIIDVVLHHTCGCPVCNARKDEAFVYWSNQMWVIANKFSQVGWVKRLLQNRAQDNNNQDSRFTMLDWGPRNNFDEQPELLLKQKKFLGKLVLLGADGFRFDAAKHIRPKYLSELTQYAQALALESRGEQLLCYGEVLDGDVNVCNEYIEAMHVTNFPLTFGLVGLLGYGGDLRHLPHQGSLNCSRAITFGDCHDSVLGNAYRFGHPRDALLATCLLLARGDSNFLIYHTQASEPSVIRGIQFCEATRGLPWKCGSMSTENLLFIERGDVGLCILNKSNDWVDMHALRLPSMRRNSLYWELTFEFEVAINGEGWISKWGSHNRGGLKIGPREVLYLIVKHN